MAQFTCKDSEFRGNRQPEGEAEARRVICGAGYTGLQSTHLLVETIPRGLLPVKKISGAGTGRNQPSQPYSATKLPWASVLD